MPLPLLLKNKLQEGRGFLKIIYFIFWVGPDLRCCVRASSHYGEWELFSSFSSRAAHCCGFSCCRAQAPVHTGSLAASCHLESSQIRDGTHVPCIGRWILSHSTIKEVQREEVLSFFLKTILSPGSRTVAMHSRSLINVAVCMYI